MSLESSISKHDKKSDGLFGLLDAELNEGITVRLASVWNDAAYSLRSATILEDGSGSLQQPALGYMQSQHITTALAGAIYEHGRVEIAQGSTAAPAEAGWEDVDAMFDVDTEILMEKRSDKIVAQLSSGAIRSIALELDSAESSLKSLANHFKSLRS